MLIHLVRLNDPWLDVPVGAFTKHAGTDRVGVHHLSDSPEEADIILFTQCHMLPDDWRMTRIRHHPLTRAFPEKVLVYNELDRPWCALPGVYVSMPQRHFVAEHQRPWGYFVDPPAVTDPAPDLLFSFVGRDTARCRRPLLRLQHADAVVEEVNGFRLWEPASPGFEERRARFREILARSRFVLCPRGNGMSSVRLYEALSVGAVPVIIADDWTPPPGPAWETLSIRWPEGRIDGLTEMLEARDAEWPHMSQLARRAYEDYFSPAVYFHRVAELCAELVRAGSPSRFPARGVIDRHVVRLAARRAGMRPVYAFATLRRKARRLRRRRAPSP